MEQDVYRGGESVRPHFYIDFVEDPVKTKLVGRPVMRAVERVTVLVGSDRTHRPVFTVTDEHRRRWPDDYAAFRAAVPADLEGGVPLRGMPGLSLKREHELKALNVLFVEQLLTGTDDEAVKLYGPDAPALRKAAIAYMRGDHVDKSVDSGDKPAGEREPLREQLRALGVKPDGRWSAKRLREEIEKAQQPAESLEAIRERIAATL